MSKIYADTEMARMPKCCADCAFERLVYGREDMPTRCNVNQADIENRTEQRSPNCPLRQGLLIEDRKEVE